MPKRVENERGFDGYVIVEEGGAAGGRRPDSGLALAGQRQEWENLGLRRPKSGQSVEPAAGEDEEALSDEGVAESDSNDKADEANEAKDEANDKPARKRAKR